MIRKALSLAAAVAMLPASPATAQSTTQDELQERYDRALAAGYKALFLCSAIANAEAVGVTRSEQSVTEWELTGIQSPLNDLAQELPHTVWRADHGKGVLSYVTVEWADDMPPRMAFHQEAGGCSILPIGVSSPPERERLRRSYPEAYVNIHSRVIPEHMQGVFEAAFGDAYGADARTTGIIVSGRSGDGLWRYAPGFNAATPQRTWSVAKSIAATLIGAAVHRGDIEVDASADLGESEDDTRRAITIDDGLRMATGRYSDTPGNRTDPLYFGGATVDEVAVDWPLINEPGSVFRYANNDTLIAVQAIEDTFEKDPPATVLRQLGMRNTVAETDWQGNYILSSQVWATAPDLMRLGQLYLNNGVTEDGTRVLPENWLEYVSTPSGPQPDGPLGYGASWWLVNKSEGIPADTIAAIGNRGQFVIVVPSRDVVIVRRGEDPVGSRFDVIAFTRDVLAALEE